MLSWPGFFLMLVHSRFQGLPSVFIQKAFGTCTSLCNFVKPLKVKKLQMSQAMSGFWKVHHMRITPWSHRLTTHYLHDQKFICILSKHGPRPWASICLLLLSSLLLTTRTTFPHLCCVEWPKWNSGLAVLPDECSELICRSCSKLWFPYGFRILIFWENGILVSLLATGKAKKGRKFFVVLLMPLLCILENWAEHLVQRYGCSVWAIMVCTYDCEWR